MAKLRSTSHHGDGFRPWSHPACLPDDLLLTECDASTGRSGGPGGQHRNKVETLVRLVHRSSGIDAHAGERRSQIENRAVALRRLRLALAVGVRFPVPIGSIGSDLWKSRVSPATGRLLINPDHHDFPALLAEALDVIAAARWDAGNAALRLQVSASQLIKLVKAHPPAASMWNRARAERGLHALK